MATVTMDEWGRIDRGEGYNPHVLDLSTSPTNTTPIPSGFNDFDLEQTDPVKPDSGLNFGAIFGDLAQTGINESNNLFGSWIRTTLSPKEQENEDRINYGTTDAPKPTAASAVAAGMGKAAMPFLIIGGAVVAIMLVWRR